MFWIIDYFWRPEGTNLLLVGRIISPKPDQLENEAEKLMKGERGSISAIRGPFGTEHDAQVEPSPFVGLVM